MAVLTGESVFSIEDVASVTYDEVTVSVVSAVAYPGGKGRLTHPVYGVYDYEIAPDEWTNVDANVIYPPIWEHTRTLPAVASTKWAGSLMDVEVQERWLGRVAMKAPQFRMFVDMWMNPPSTGNTVWSPNYITSNSFNVQIVSVASGGSQGITLDYTVLQGDGFIKGPFEITYRVLSVA